ncbi:uncharacterized protein LOC143202292 isoform X2 [Rhynchophorus ferrugineus]|uniref:uncharacterized protein LOC143202292 isoform X2 n=1 Tax=Rhynchophorus ferrugineus TaxID=354439 RepID=UPI003FCE2AA3
MAAVSPPPISTFSISEADQKKTVYTLLSNINKPKSVSVAKSDSLTSEDLVILRHNPATNENSINRSAYLKLHRNTSPNRNSVIDKLKENFESNQQSNRPVARARRNRLTKSQLLLPRKHSVKTDRYSLNIEKRKDVNSNHIGSSRDTLSNDEDQYVTIVRRSDSEESIVKIKEVLSAFTLDTEMEKKNKTGLRKFFSAFRNKDKKKKSDDNNKTQNKDNAGMYSDNYQNESNNFSRQSTFRHTTGGENYSIKSPTQKPTVQRSDSDAKVPNPYLDEKIEREYAQQHINQFNKVKQNFENGVCQNSDSTKDRYTPMDKPLKDSSSSASTLESDKSNIYANEPQQPNDDSTDDVKDTISPIPTARIAENKRDTPPRLLETKQDVRLVNPKALIPINSERALPNPYQNVYVKSPVNVSPPNATRQSRNEQYQIMTLPMETTPQRPNLSDTYGTVFDSIEDRTLYVGSGSTRTSPKETDKVPRSPSLEPSKLKLPPNREIVPLAPRVRSPIPSDNVSTEKIIATELLKARKSPKPTKRNNRDYSPTHQRLEIDIDYPDNIKNVSKDSLLLSTDNLSAKPPSGTTNKQPFKPIQENGRFGSDNHRQSQASPSSADTLYRRSQSSPLGSTDKIITNAQVHINPSVNRTPTPNNSMQNLSLSPIKSFNGTARSITPSVLKANDSPKTPQKEDIRKSVEAYYWKEVRKLKDREDQELYMLQMQYENCYPYFEEPTSVRRSRSLSPSASRNSRRSLSLPRDIKTQPQTVVAPEKRYYPNAIPENHAVHHQVHPKSLQQIQFQQQKYFNRAAPERRTFDGGSPRKIDSTSSLYRPIFKRGSLNTPIQQTIDDPLKRKVSFSGASDQNVQSWPTKNGFTKSPPQRRILDKSQSQLDDDVFVPSTPNDIRYNQFRTNSRTDSTNEQLYYNTKPNTVRANGDQFYISKGNINPQYMTQKQIAEGPYAQRVAQFDDALYGQPRDSLVPQPQMPVLVRHGSIQIAEELGYMPRPGLRRVSYQNNNIARRPSAAPTPTQELHGGKTPQPLQLRREIILNDEIFGQFGGYVPNQDIVRGSQTPSIYSSRQSIAEYPQVRPSPRQISVNNKVCDIYGQIHDMDNPRVQQTGVIMGQLHRNPGSPMMVRNSYSQLPAREPFVRNSRLTASANDMYHRPQQNVPYSTEQLYGRLDSQMNETEVFNRPLPPVPQGRKMMNRNIISDTESVSDINDVHRMMNGTRSRGIYGK